jgi:putative tryptophan/tyrosine transport system substrate-binding protein
MKRREVLTLLGGVATWPLAANAQQSAMPVIGFLNAASPNGYAPMVEAFRQGLAKVGYIEGRNVTIEYRWAEGKPDRLPGMVADLIRRPVNVLVATTTQAALAAKAATTEIPIVFELASDPVKLGLVTSLNRPGGNVTGATQLNIDVTPKRLEVMRELIPTATLMAALVNPANPALAEPTTQGLQAAARTLGLQLHVLHARSESELDAAFMAALQLRASGLVIGTDPLFSGHSKQLALLAVRHAVPTIYAWREFAAAGGLIAYGASNLEAYQLTGVYTGRILKGEKPADLPVQQATKIELFLNLKTAKALGITVPTGVLVRADEVIE